MGMNNAHRLKLKLSLQKIVNLEMFVGVSIPITKRIVIIGFTIWELITVIYTYK